MSDNDYDLKVGANVDGATAEFDKLSNSAEKSAKKIQEVMDKSPADIKEKLSSVTQWFKTE